MTEDERDARRFRVLEEWAVSWERVEGHVEVSHYLLYNGAGEQICELDTLTHVADALLSGLVARTPEEEEVALQRWRTEDTHNPAHIEAANRAKSEEGQG